jgi:hypothetical protein
MSEKKNHNSLIFITTLSVYLGLVLVGSSPAVLAQAATTRLYDIRSEIVVEDELDKKPDDQFGGDVSPGDDDFAKFAADFGLESESYLEDGAAATRISWKLSEFGSVGFSGPGSKLRAETFVAQLGIESARKNRPDASDLNTRIKLSSQIFSNNSQFTMVTALPRASIDELLAR